MAQKQKSDKEMVVSTGATAAATRRKSAPRANATARTKHSLAEPDASAEVPASQPVTAAAVAQAATMEPTYEQIATLAYLYWEARGCQGGCPEEDWLRAEQELRSR
jgi:hypothetical protein